MPDLANAFRSAVMTSADVVVLLVAVLSVGSCAGRCAGLGRLSRSGRQGGLESRPRAARGDCG